MATEHLSKTVNFKERFLSILDSSDTETTAKRLSVTPNNVRKWVGGNLDQGFAACQKMVNEMIEAGELTLVNGMAPERGKKAPSNTPSKAMTSLAAIFGPDVAEKTKEWLKTFEEHGSLFVRSIGMGEQRDVTHGIVEAPQTTSYDTKSDETPNAPDFSQLDKPKEVAKPLLGRLSPEQSAAARGVIETGPDAIEKSHFAILLPTHRDFPPVVLMDVLAQWKATLPEEVAEALAPLHLQSDSLIHRARNVLAERFLASGQEWSYWQDSDIVAPTGNAAWFKTKVPNNYPDDFFRQAAIRRLTGHNKSIVSAVYCQRNHTHQLLNQMGVNPANKTHKELAERLKQGPVDKLVEVQWSGFGCIAVHRQVFLDIAEKCPDVKGTKEGDPRGFFNPTPQTDGPEVDGEDIAFCKRARDAGHPTFLDCAVIAGHVGRTAYLP